MNKIKITVAAIGMFLALPVVHTFAIEQRSVSGFGRTVTGGVLQNGGTTTKPPVLVQPVPYQCHTGLGQCDCSNAADCGRMGQAGVCKAGSYNDNQTKPGGWCQMKQ